MALVRNFSMKEKADLLLRVEHFNVLNHTNFWRSGNHQQRLDREDYGHDSTRRREPNDPRMAQFSLKLLF